MKQVSAVICSIAILAATGVFAADSLKKGKAAFGSWQDDKPGVTRLISPEDLPAADESKSSENSADPIKMPEGAKPLLPKGFSVQLVASGIKSPRIIRVAPNGDIFVADSKADQIRIYRLQDGAATVEKDGIFAAGLHQPYGIAFYPPGPTPEWIYIGNSNSVVRFPYKNGDLKASGEPEVIVDHIPAAHHWTRDIVFSADGSKL